VSDEGLPNVEVHESVHHNHDPDSMRAQRERVATAAQAGSTTGQAFRANVRAERTEPAAAAAAPVLSKRMVVYRI
jgi:hypothetical protein